MTVDYNELREELDARMKAGESHDSILRWLNDKVQQINTDINEKDEGVITGLILYRMLGGFEKYGNL